VQQATETAALVGVETAEVETAEVDVVVVDVAAVTK
jgi:hypothetical protein